MNMLFAIQGVEPANTRGTSKEDVWTRCEVGRRIRRIFCWSVL